MHHLAFCSLDHVTYFCGSGGFCPFYHYALAAVLNTCFATIFSCTSQLRGFSFPISP